MPALGNVSGPISTNFSGVGLGMKDMERSAAAALNVELIEELETELHKGNLEEIRAITADLQENERKINRHGRRADSIVKSMLEHSRTTKGAKELTALGKLADEYLRLAYHGLRAKEKSFNAELVTRFDQELPPVPVAPQDIGRVLLNILNNAFYAVRQQQIHSETDYRPRVTVSTLLREGQALIVVQDNGTGIPENIKNKIMQPFFTTKPTGLGTGLGLSLSYDIIVKGHGGKITVDSEEGKGTEIMLSLPIQ